MFNRIHKDLGLESSKVVKQFIIDKLSEKQTVAKLDYKLDTRMKNISIEQSHVGEAKVTGELIAWIVTNNNTRGRINLKFEIEGTDLYRELSDNVEAAYAKLAEAGKKGSKAGEELKNKLIKQHYDYQLDN